MSNGDTSIYTSEQKPILIIGMHRSGTSLLAKTLRESGVFMGKDVQRNHESVLFMTLNNELFMRCYSTWNNPFGIHLAMQNRQVVGDLSQLAYKDMLLNSDRFLGSGKRSGIENILDIDFVWGWKDPRNTFTLPVWSHIFPNNRIIHIMRHGVDVANSLFQRDWAKYHKVKNAYMSSLNVWNDKFGLHHNRRGWTLEQSFTIWEEYVEAAVQHVKSRGERALQIRFEDLLQDPRAILEKIFLFCRINPSIITSDLIASFNPNRAYAHKIDPYLCEFASEKHEILSQFGY